MTNGNNYEFQNGVLRCSLEEPETFYREDPTRILTLFTVAAKNGCSIEADTYAAAQAAMPEIQRLRASIVREAVQNILLSDTPEALDPLLSSGALMLYGLTASGDCLRSLRDVPCTMETRWWVFLRLCHAQYSLVCEKLGFSSEFAKTLTGLDRLENTLQLPCDVPQLKSLLSRLPEIDYVAAVQTLLRQDSRWLGQISLYEQLYETGEPYLFRHLAVTPGDLAVKGIRGAKAAWIMRGLMDAVIKAPDINTKPALMSLIQTLSAQYN